MARSGRSVAISSIAGNADGPLHWFDRANVEVASRNSWSSPHAATRLHDHWIGVERDAYTRPWFTCLRSSLATLKNARRFDLTWTVSPVRGLRPS